MCIRDRYNIVHALLQREDIDRVYWAGDAGKEGQTIEELSLIHIQMCIRDRLHTGRSRNDQVALDMRLFTRKTVKETDNELKELLAVDVYKRQCLRRCLMQNDRSGLVMIMDSYKQ